MSKNQYATFCKGDPFSIKMVGSNEFVKEKIDTLVLDFEEPKFGYCGELWDEDECFEPCEAY